MNYLPFAPESDTPPSPPPAPGRSTLYTIFSPSNVFFMTAEIVEGET